MPSDPTQTSEWNALQAHAQEMSDIHMRDLFAEDDERAAHFSLTLEGLLFDYSKHIITQETLEKLLALAKIQDVEDMRDALFAGETLNESENRAALHPALRGSCENTLSIDGENINEFVSSALQSIQKINDTIRSDKKIKNVVNIGIGGSDLGPHTACEALKSYTDGPQIHFVSNVDSAHLTQTLAELTPESTIIIIASKTFTTLETMTNAHSAKEWLGAYAEDHMVGVTAAEKAALDFGIKTEHILPMREWIGGRYSLWSAIGLPIAISTGFDNFEKLLAGANAADTHFKNALPAQNIPVIMALLSIWYRNFCGMSAHAILPYAQNLHRLPAYIQQLEMESNGKSVNRSGEGLPYKTAPVVFGEPGTNAQHAFFQMLHQGTDTIPCDFIAAIAPDKNHGDHHKKLLAIVIGQSQALMQGQKNSNGHQNFPGNKPSSTILLPRLDPYYTGMLLALYEHKTFVEGIIWNINSFDQWGVELGKSCASGMLNSPEESRENADPSTKSLLKHIRDNGHEL